MPTRWLKLTVAYDGTAYAGWQIQPTEPTVQARDRNGLARDHARRAPRHRRRPHRRRRPRARPGRRPRHRIALSTADLHRGLNAVLPDDVAIVAVEDAREDFHATHDAIAQDLPLPNPQRPHARRLQSPLRLALSAAARRRKDARRRAGPRRQARLLQLRIRRLRTPRLDPHALD